MELSKLAPVALFVYKRLDHVKKTLESLAKNELAEQTDLIVFSDGPRSTDDIDNVTNVRFFLNRIKGFKSVKIVLRNTNLGLSESIRRGLDELFDEFESVIVLEDDMISSPYFLKFMNEALEKYVKDERVVSISGYVYPTKERLPENFFIRGADCWGWATWKRGWRLYSNDGHFLLKKIINSKLESKFDFNRSYPYTEMLIDQVDGRNDSWAIRWYASTFLLEKLTLYPGCSLIHNIGNDQSGTHSMKSNIYDTSVSLEPIKIIEIDVVESVIARKIIERYFRGIFDIKILLIRYFLSANKIRFCRKIMNQICGKNFKKIIKKLIYGI